MAISPTKQRWEIPITAVDAPTAFVRHRRIVQNIIDGLSEPERKIIADKRHTKIEISGKPPEHDVAGYWDDATDTIHLFTTPINPRYPECMKPLIKHFPFVAAHEIHHPLIYDIKHYAGRYDSAFKRAHRSAVVRLHEDKNISRKIADITSAMHKTITYGAPESEFLEVDYGWKKIDPNNREQLGVMLGVLLSDEYYETYKYTMQPFGRGRSSDGRYEEMLCNVKALAHVFGEDKVREFAGGLLDYIDKLNPHRNAPDNPPRSGRRPRAEALRDRHSHNKAGVAIR